MFNISPDTKSTYSTIASLNLNPIANTPNGNIQTTGVFAKNDKCWSKIGGSILTVPLCLLIAKELLGSFSNNSSNLLQTSRCIYDLEGTHYNFLLLISKYFCQIYHTNLFAPLLHLALDALRTLHEGRPALLNSSLV